MSNYLSMINQMARYSPDVQSVNFLVSGKDTWIMNRILADICSSAYKHSKNLIVIDDSGKLGMNLNEIERVGYTLTNGLSGAYPFSNMLDTNSIQGLARFRSLLSSMGYEEKEKQKIVAYLKFIQYVEGLKNPGCIPIITMDILSTYSAGMLVEKTVQSLLLEEKINPEQQQYLLSKYSEVCSAGADFENSFYLLAPFMNGGGESFDKAERTAFVFSLRDFSRDQIIKGMLCQLIIDTLSESVDKMEVLILDEGLGKNKYLSELMGDLPDNCCVHLLTGDICTMGELAERDKLENLFLCRIYGRHSNMRSCESLSEVLGKVEVAKSTYTATYDRRLRANMPWDILLGKNKTEIYGTAARTWEPKFAKEVINSLPSGTAVMEIMGNSSLVSI